MHLDAVRFAERPVREVGGLVQPGAGDVGPQLGPQRAGDPLGGQAVTRCQGEQLDPRGGVAEREGGQSDGVAAHLEGPENLDLDRHVAVTPGRVRRLLLPSRRRDAEEAADPAEEPVESAAQPLSSRACMVSARTCASSAGSSDSERP